jgi:hypothetical protein
MRGETIKIISERHSSCVVHSEVIAGVTYQKYLQRRSQLMVQTSLRLLYVPLDKRDSFKD